MWKCKGKAGAMAKMNAVKDFEVTCMYPDGDGKGKDKWARITTAKVCCF